MASAKDVYPPRDLPGRADNWGRRVEEVDRDLFDRQVQLRQSLDNGLRSTSGQLAVLARQIDAITAAQQDLKGRESYASFWSNSPISVNTNVSDIPLDPLSVSFTLDSPRVVKVQTFLEVAASRGSGAASATLGLVHTLSGGSILDVTETSQGFTRQVATGETVYSQVIVNSLFTRPAGVYSITPRYSTSVTPNGFVVLSQGVTVVDILQQTT